MSLTELERQIFPLRGNPSPTQLRGARERVSIKLQLRGCQKYVLDGHFWALYSWYLFKHFALNWNIMSKLPRSALHCSVVWACECIICFVALQFFLLFFSFPPFLSLLSCLVIWRNRKILFPVKIWIEIVPTIRSQCSGTVYRAREETREDSERKEIGASKGDRSTEPALRSQFGIFFHHQKTTQGLLYSGVSKYSSHHLAG